MCCGSLAERREALATMPKVCGSGDALGGANGTRNDKWCEGRRRFAEGELLRCQRPPHDEAEGVPASCRQAPPCAPNAAPAYFTMIDTA
jgi:hypothetical protein